jgi:hypothetical protein
MAIPTTRSTFKDYCLRRLGSPVIDINVDEEQTQDRIDDALAKFRDYHYDGTERVLISHEVTQTDKDNGYITLEEDVVGVIRVLDIGDAINASNLFNIRYQIHLNDLFDFSSSSYVSYVMAMRHVETLEEIFVGSKPIRFNRHKDQLHIDMQWSEDVAVGEYIIIDGYKTLDPEVYADVWNDPWLKKYATALIKRQWGENLKKFEGMQLPGGIQFNGQKIWEEATEEINKIEEELNSTHSLPVMDMVG